MREVGGVLERDDGMMVRIEVKAFLTARFADLTWVRTLAGACPGSGDVIPFGDLLRLSGTETLGTG